MGLSSCMKLHLNVVVNSVKCYYIYMCVCVPFPVCCDICGHESYKYFLLTKCMINLYNIVAHEKYDNY